MTPERIAELRKLCSEATPGPWYSGAVKFVLRMAGQHDRPEGDRTTEDAAFIATAREALPEALNEIERLRTLDAGCLQSRAQDATVIVALQEESARLQSKRAQDAFDIGELQAEVARMRAALEKIADPRKRDHKEPDAYTELGCVMNIALAALEGGK